MLVAVCGAALAQPPVADWVTLTIEPFETPVQPLQAPSVTRFTMSASCLLAEGDTKVIVRYLVEDAPAWATVVVSPASDVAHLDQCEQGRVTREGQIIVTATDQAPAFIPTPIRISAIVGTSTREQKGQGVVNVSAGYFPILDVQLDEAIAVIAPGASHEFEVTLTNLGNGDTRVTPTLVQGADGITLDMPPQITLESRQAGGSRTTGRMIFSVRAADANGLVNRADTITVRLDGAYALDDAKGVDSSTVSFLVTTRTGGANEGHRTLPLGSLAAGVAIALAAWVSYPIASQRRR